MIIINGNTIDNDNSDNNANISRHITILTILASRTSQYRRRSQQ